MIYENGYDIDVSIDLGTNTLTDCLWVLHIMSQALSLMNHGQGEQHHGKETVGVLSENWDLQQHLEVLCHKIS